MIGSKTGSVATGRDARTVAFVGILFGVALLIAASTALILWRGRLDTLRRADTAAEALVQAVSKDLGRSIGGYDLSLRWAINALSALDPAQTSDGLQRQMMFATDLNASTLGGLLIANDTGRKLFETGTAATGTVNIADTPYFKALRDNPELGLFVSPQVHPAGNGPSIALARRYVDNDGDFAGVVVSMVKLSFIYDLIRTATKGSKDSVALLGDDGQLIAREPWDTRLVGRNLKNGPLWPLLAKSPTGSFDSVAMVDGAFKRYHYARVADLPLVLLVGSAFSTIYADWWTGAIAIGGITATTILLLLGLAWALHQELGRRHRAERIARSSADQFRMMAENVSDIIVRLNLDGVRSYISPSVETVLGYTPQEMLEAGQWLMLVHPDDKQIALDAMAALRAGTEQITVAYRVTTKQGVEVWLEANIRLLRDIVTNQPSEMIAVSRDVTSRYIAEQEFKRLAIVDGLTGVANRRGFDEAMDKEWRRAMRAEEHIALLLLDADYFKLYNDRYGHQGGDDVLCMIARCATAHVRRPGDLAARYGGEEFAVLLLGTDLQGAMMIAEQIRMAIQNEAIPHEASPLRKVTVSVGVACSLAIAGDSPHALIQRADLALYEAKRSGRNRVVAADPVIPAPVGRHAPAG